MPWCLCETFSLDNLIFCPVHNCKDDDDINFINNIDDGILIINLRATQVGSNSWIVERSILGLGFSDLFLERRENCHWCAFPVKN